MPKFSQHFSLGLSQRQLDFVDISTDYDTPVYVDPYAIEIRNDVWSNKASELIGTFFEEVLTALKDGDEKRALSLMSHFGEPRETFLGVSKGKPDGRGVGPKQAAQLIRGIKSSRAYKTGLLTDLSEMALFVENVDRDKISDLTTNIIRDLLVDYTQAQCELWGIETEQYANPPSWNNDLKNWKSSYVQLPYIGDRAIMLVPKYIVRRKLSLDSQEFYNKQITDFLVSENERANTSLVHVIQKKKGPPRRVVYKTEVREKNPRSKAMITDIVAANPKLLELYKQIARAANLMSAADIGEPSTRDIAGMLVAALAQVPAGRDSADQYHTVILGALTFLFYPDLVLPQKEWKINDGRKRVDIVFTNAADNGFFARMRDGRNTQANLVIVECKNYSDDIANPELDQLLGRFDENRGKFGILVCREIDKQQELRKRCRDMSSRSQGYVIVLTDQDIIAMLNAKVSLNDQEIEDFLSLKFQELLE